MRIIPKQMFSGATNFIALQGRDGWWVASSLDSARPKTLI